MNGLGTRLGRHKHGASVLTRIQLARQTWIVCSRGCLWRFVVATLSCEDIWCGGRERERRGKGRERGGRIRITHCPGKHGRLMVPPSRVWLGFTLSITAGPAPRSFCTACACARPCSGYPFTARISSPRRRWLAVKKKNNKKTNKKKEQNR